MNSLLHLRAISKRCIRWLLNKEFIYNKRILTAGQLKEKVTGGQQRQRNPHRQMIMTEGAIEEMEGEESTHQGQDKEAEAGTKQE